MKLATIQLLGACACAAVAGAFASHLWTDRPVDRDAYQSPLSVVQAVDAAHAAARSLGGLVYAVADTGSMRPLIDSNCYVVLVETPFDGVQAGDIVGFWRGHSLVLHLVFERTPSELRTRPLNGAGWDSRDLITADNYAGSLAAIVPFRK
jgi:hypothetical protein